MPPIEISGLLRMLVASAALLDGLMRLVESSACMRGSGGPSTAAAFAAAKDLGDGTRVVSVPCFERFARQSEEYRKDVLPDSCRRRVAIEAGVPDPWFRYVGLDGKIIGLTRFGISAPGAEVMKEFGIDAKHVIEAAKSLK